MKKLLCLMFTLLICSSAMQVVGDDGDSVAAIFVFGRMGGWMASGFAVGSGDRVVVPLDLVQEPAQGGKKALVRHTAVISAWTGEVYPAVVIAADEEKEIALLELKSAAVPPVMVADTSALSRAPRATLGQLFSGEEIGGKFPAQILGLDAQKQPPRFKVSVWQGSNACLTEIRSLDWLFLSKVEPPEKATKGAVVVKPGIGALGMFMNRLVIEGSDRPTIFYRVLPAPALREFLIKSGVSRETLDKPPSIGPKSADADTAFQTLCLALSSSIMGVPVASDAAAAAVKIRPKNATAHMLLGMALTRQSKFNEAVKSMTTAIELDPSLPDARLHRAAAYLAAGRLDEAEKDLKAVIADDPKDDRPLMALANLLLGVDGRLEDAEKYARDLIRIVPDDPAAHVTLARVLKHKKDYNAAVKELQWVLERAPAWGEAHAALAVTYEAAGKPDLAEAQYRKLVEIDPNSPDSHIALIEFLVSADKKDDARKAIEKARELKLQPEAVDALKKLEDQLGTEKAEDQPEQSDL